MTPEEQRENNRLKMKAWRAANPERHLENGRKRYAKNKEHINLLARRRYDADPQKRRDYERIHRKGRYAREIKPKMQSDPAFRVLLTLRSRLNRETRRGMAGKAGHTMDLLGCSMGRFGDYISAHFTEGMSWANFGKWVLDHRRPCSSFPDLTDPSQQAECFSYLNLRPMWAIDNLRKGSKYQPPSTP